MISLFRGLAVLALLAAFGPSAQAQGCGSSNPNCIVPTMPLNDASNRAASDAFVQNQIAALPINNAITALVGDGTATGPGSSTFTLKTVNSNVGAFGSATQCSTITVNAKGLITAASATACTPGVGSITGLGSGIGSWLATPSSANLAAAMTDETGTGSLVFNTSPTLNGTTTLSGGALDTFIVGNTATANALTVNSQGDVGVGELLAPDSSHHLSFEIMRNQNTDAAFTLRNRNDGSTAKAVLHFFAGTADQNDASLDVQSIAAGAATNWRCGAGSTGGCNILQAANGPINFFSNNTQRGLLSGAGAWQFTSAGTTASAANAFLDGSNTLLKSTSSLRYKKDLADLTNLEADTVLRLHPFTYSSIAPADKSDARFFGFAAEEVADIDPRLVNYDNDGRPDGVQYDRIVVPLVQKVQELNACLGSWKCRLFGIH